MRWKRPPVRVLCCLLICLFVVNLLPIQSVKAADYTEWKQSDAQWGETAVGDNGTMAKWGCKITVIAMLMVKASVEHQTDFNPGVLLERFEKGGFITHSSNVSDDGNLYYSAVSKENSPQFYLEGSKIVTGMTDDYVKTVITSLLADGYYIEARVKNDRHSVAVDYCEGDEVYILDPGYDKSMLSEWSGTVTKLNYYKACPDEIVLETNETTENILEEVDKNTLTIKNVNYPTAIALGNVFSIYGTVASQNSVLKKLTVGVYTKEGKLVTGKTVVPNAKSYNIKKLDAYVKFGTLSAGTYYYRIKAANADGTGTLVNKKFEVS